MDTKDEIQGIDHYGVVAYLNKGPHKGEKNYVKGHYTGLKWECVEYARRWFIQMRGITFEDVATAEDLWKLKTAKEITTGKNITFMNGTRKNGKGMQATSMPPVGALLIYRKTNKDPYGHVAVVVKVNRVTVDVAEQNYSLKKWKGYSRRVNMTDPDIIGWKNIN